MSLHDGLATFSRFFAESSAWQDWLIDHGADGKEERAEEQFDVFEAVDRNESMELSEELLCFVLTQMVKRIWEEGLVVR